MAEELSRLVLHTQDGVLVAMLKDAQLFGEADISEVAQLLQAIIGQDKPKLVIDLTRVAGAGSMFFGMLMQLRRQINERGGRLALAGAGPFLRQSLRIAGIDRIVPVLDDVEQARKRVQG